MHIPARAWGAPGVIRLSCSGSQQLEENLEHCGCGLSHLNGCMNKSASVGGERGNRQNLGSSQWAWQAALTKGPEVNLCKSLARIQVPIHSGRGPPRPHAARSMLLVYYIHNFTFSAAHQPWLLDLSIFLKQQCANTQIPAQYF